MPKKLLKILHIITGLDTGGAELALYKLLSTLKPSEFSSHVISLKDQGDLGERIRSLGIAVTALNMHPGIPHFLDITNLSRIIREKEPHIIQTWMYHADLLGGLASRFSKRIPLVWNIRNSTLDRNTSKRTTRYTVYACARASHHWPQKIVSCSETARQLHVNLGYDAKRMIVIPNGFDLALFRPNPDARQSLRANLGLPSETILIGAVGRFDPQKDYLTMIKAATRLHAERSDVHFVLCGTGLTSSNSILTNWIDEHGLQSVFHLLGQRSDIPEITAAFDLATSSSAYGEAFSNVLGEAMACGIPFVATNVGDAATILGEAGKVVPPRDPDSLAAAWLDILSMSASQRSSLGNAGRNRIQTHFNLPVIAEKYADLYRKLAFEVH
jgi:glycosyltransferase involved in cell wall biosynthesis